MEISKYWKTIVDTLQDGLMVLDPEGNILAVNPAAEKLTGYTAEELIGNNCRTLNCTGCDVFGFISVLFASIIPTRFRACSTTANCNP